MRFQKHTWWLAVISGQLSQDVSKMEKYNHLSREDDYDCCIFFMVYNIGREEAFFSCFLSCCFIYSARKMFSSVSSNAGGMMAQCRSVPLHFRHRLVHTGDVADWQFSYSLQQCFMERLAYLHDQFQNRSPAAAAATALPFASYKSHRPQVFLC